MTKLLRSPWFALATAILIVPGLMNLAWYRGGYPGLLSLGLLITLTPLLQALQQDLREKGSDAEHAGDQGGIEQSVDKEARRAVVALWRVVWVEGMVLGVVSIAGPIFR